MLGEIKNYMLTWAVALVVMIMIFVWFYFTLASNVLPNWNERWGADMYVVWGLKERILI